MSPRRPDLATRTFSAVVVGCSAGGQSVLSALLTPMGAGLPVPIIVAQHLHKHDDGLYASHLDAALTVAVREAHDKLMPRGHRVYIAPADYHLLVERGGSLALSIDPRVKWSRPSVDVLFESAARAHGAKLIAVVLSGANDDGAEGCRAVRQHGGLCLAQDPATAEAPVMPRAAMAAAESAICLPPAQLGTTLMQLNYSAPHHRDRGRTQGEIR